MASSKKSVPVGTLVDQIAKLDLKIHPVEAQLSVLAKQRDALVTLLMNAFAEQKTESAKGALASAVLVRRSVVSFEDYDKFMAYVYKNKAGDLLQRRIASTAYFERIENKQKVPGAKVEVIRSVRITPNKGSKEK